MPAALFALGLELVGSAMVGWALVTLLLRPRLLRSYEVLNGELPAVVLIGPGDTLVVLVAGVALVLLRFAVFRAPRDPARPEAHAPHGDAEARTRTRMGLLAAGLGVGGVLAVGGLLLPLLDIYRSTA